MRHLSGLATFFATLTAVISISNDLLTKYLSPDIHIAQISFLRFLFSLISLVPFATLHNIKNLTSHAKQHAWRSVIGALAIALYIYGLTHAAFPVVVTLSLTQILFCLPISAAILKETAPKSLVVFSILGFSGVLIFFYPHTTFAPASIWGYIAVLCSSALFATLDVLAKKLVSQKASTFSLLFYFAFTTTAVSAPFGVWFWQPISLKDWALLFCIGSGANLIQISLFAALKRAPANRTTPFRYLELLFATAAGYFLFNEALHTHEVCGILIIILATYGISQRYAILK